jgi:hypothetical protein
MFEMETTELLGEARIISGEDWSRSTVIYP